MSQKEGSKSKGTKIQKIHTETQHKNIMANWQRKRETQTLKPQGTKANTTGNTQLNSKSKRGNRWVE